MCVAMRRLGVVLFVEIIRFLPIGVGELLNYHRVEAVFHVDVIDTIHVVL